MRFGFRIGFALALGFALMAGCSDESDGQVFPCTEQGIRDAIAEGGGAHTFACDGSKTVVTEATIDIDNDVTLDGAGNLTVDGGGDHLLFLVPEGVEAELRRLRIVNGGSELWGGIRNAGSLTLEECTVSGNSTEANGGGIRNSGTLSLIDSALTGNSAFRGGGISNYGGTVSLLNSTIADNTAQGIENDSNGSVTLTNSTVRGNSQGISNTGTMTLIGSTVSENNGWGIENRGTMTLTESIVSDNETGIVNRSTMTLTDSTVSSNSGGINPGGIYNNGDLMLVNSTVSSNSTEDNGGGISNEGILTLVNSTVSENAANGLGGGVYDIGVCRVLASTLSGNEAETGSQIAHMSLVELEVENSLIDGDCLTATTISNGHNVESPGDTCGFDTNKGDQVNVSPEDLNLGPLADNGGPTKTHKPGDGGFGEGSAAIDWIPAAQCLDADGEPLTTDQRGEPRPETGGTMCDVGAFEVQP